jgi:UDP-N-acetylmuramyl pentapeptide synthase
VEASVVGSRRQLRVALDGQFGFQVHNALFAAAIAHACGIGGTDIAGALERFAPSPRLMPGSFNVVDVDGATVVVDRSGPSWFLRPALRAVGHLPARRPLVVAGRMERTPDADLGEVGRLLGRVARAIILHAEEVSPVRAQFLRQGIAANPVPPVLVHVPTESRALRRMLQLVQPGELGFVLADDVAAVLRALERTRARQGTPAGDTRQ